MQYTHEHAQLLLQYYHIPATIIPSNKHAFRCCVWRKMKEQHDCSGSGSGILWVWQTRRRRGAVAEVAVTYANLWRVMLERLRAKLMHHFITNMAMGDVHAAYIYQKHLQRCGVRELFGAAS